MASDLTSFIELLKQDLQTLSELEEILLHERESLEKNELDHLDKLTNKKTPLLVQLEANAAAKSAWVRGCKLPLPRLLELLESKAPAAMSLYRQCNSRIKAVHQLNEVNGRIVATSHQRVEKLMSIIRGQGQQMHIYGHNGAERAVGSHYYFAQA